MALKVWLLGVFVVFVMMWLRRRCTVRLHSHMVEDMARLFRLTAVQALSSENFSLVPVAPYVYCRPAAKDCLDEAKGPIILATRCYKLE